MDLVDPMPVGAYPVDRDGEAGNQPLQFYGQQEEERQS